MQVEKRNGSKEDVSFDKVLNRIRIAADGLEVNPTLIAQRTLMRIYDGVKTSELDELAAQLSISLMTTNPDYGTLASRIAVSNHHRNTSDKFTEVVKILANQTLEKTGEKTSIVSQELIELCEKYGAEIDAKLDYNRDYLFDYFGFKTLEKLQYLLRDNKGNTIERPQHLLMRVSLALWGSVDLEKAFETYDLLSQKYFIHATPTNFNAGTPRQQLSSCFVAGTQVHTLNGVKNIEDVIIGDEVVTHKGYIKKVSQLHKNLLNDRIIYDIKLAGTPIVSVTGNHRLWSISDEQEKWGSKPGWNSVEYLRVGDWVAIPNKKIGENYILDVKTVLDNYKSDGNNVSYRFEYNDNGTVTPYATWKKHFANDKTVSSEKKGDTFNRYWNFDETMMELIGIWYGDGCVVHGKNSAGNKTVRAINIVSYNTNSKLIEFVTKTFYEKFGIRHVTVSQDNNNMVSMTVNNQYIAYIFKELFKSGFDGKRIPSFFNRLSYDSIVGFMSGLTSSDGCVNENSNITIQLTNPPLMNDIFHLTRSVGIPSTLTLMNKEGCKATGRMNIPSSILAGKIKKVYNDNRVDNIENKIIDNWKQTRIIDGITFMRINMKTPTNKKPEYVYTLGVEDDHSYSVGGFIAENCFLLAMKEDSIVGIYDTLKDCAQISKHAGGIGLHIHNIRAKGALIKGTNGTSNGIVPMLRNFNDTARYVDQCFTPDTLVYTDNGIQKIENILPGEKVLTSENKYYTVLKQVIHNYTGHMYHITVDNNIPVTVTGEHPVLSFKSNGNTLETCILQIKAGLKEIDYNEVKDLEVGDFTVFPNGVYKQISSITPTEYSGNVYDFEIDGPHDYTVAHLGIAHNGGGKRNGSFAIYLEPWHADVEDFLKLKLNTGSEEERCRDLFYALWIPDLFMERVEKNEPWTLFCPSEAPGLADVYGDEFKALYEKYEKEGRGRKQIDAQKLWFKVLDSQIETGTPYLLYKDACNKKSNQNNLGTIKSSNLCTEVVQYSSSTESSVCNLASIALPTYVNPKTKTFNYAKLREVVKVAIKNLNRVIDINYYPTPETRNSNMRHRPVGLGVQGLADVFALMRMPWESEKAADLNQRIFEHIYYAAVESSCEIAEKDGPYSTYEGSPMSKGQFQYDLWDVQPLTEKDATLDWKGLKEKVASHGVRNSLLVAPMPTASTSQILGFNECFEPFTSNIYTRRTLAGEFIVINKHLMKDLEKLDLWNEMMKQQIIARNGSIQGIDQIPEAIQRLYKTSWEIKQKTLIDMAAARGAFICQSQSLNLFVADPNYAKLTSMHFYGWKQGLKTGMYYLRTRAPVMAQKFTVDPELQKAAEKSEHERLLKKYAPDEGCTMCSS
jgi:ribonucleoside-diphosphate reductase alpha subunit